MPGEPDDQRIKLYGFVMSPYASKVHCFLLYKQVSFSVVHVNPIRLAAELPIGSQVPVVSIGNESLADSTPIGLWLDDRLPNAPRLLPENAEERAALLEIDTWVTHSLIPGIIRFYSGEGAGRWRQGWHLGSIMHKTSEGGLPWMLRAIWPLLIRRAPFIVRLLEQAEDGLSLDKSRDRLCREFVDHLQGGPFLLGRNSPSLPDLAAFPQFALHHMTGFEGSEGIFEHPSIADWLERMWPYVSGEPALVPDVVLERALLE